MSVTINSPKVAQDLLCKPSGSLNSQSKIQDHHFQRQAVVYVRQSTPRQVLEHQESTRLQYQLVEYAEKLGWRKDRILVVDDDLGLSGSTAEGREGFQRLLAEVSLNHVGLVLGIEMSRLARSCKDWHQLLELCAMFHCLLADQDGIYDPSFYNDRLLLGLKGTMSEAELHILKGRMQEGSKNKARRGELLTHLPVGYLRFPNDEVVLDPDDQVRAVVHLLFEKFEELGSGMQVLRYFLENEILFPHRVRSGIRQGELDWKKANQSTINYLLKNPTYAGTYTYGRFQQDPCRAVAGRPNVGRFLAKMDDWKVIIHDRFPAYITWEQYLRNRNQLEENCSSYASKGVPRKGHTLLTGILICGRCGRRLQPAYQKTPTSAAYNCQGDYKHTGKSGCQRLNAQCVDELVESLVLKVIEPSSLQASLVAAESIQKERQRLYDHWSKKQERASYEASLAQRSYEVVDPENRLVARELERRWEEALVTQRKTEEGFRRFQNEQPQELSPAEIEQIDQLAVELPQLWNADSTTHADRQSIVRHLIDRVVVTVQDQTELVDVTVHWVGEFVSQHQVVRSVAMYENMHQFVEIRALIEQLWQTGHSTPVIAAQLNERGYLTPKRQVTFSRHMVRKLLDKWGLTEHKRPQISAELAQLGPDEWWLVDLGSELQIDKSTLARWCRKGWVHAHKLPGRCKWWVVWADAEEQGRLKRLFQCSQKDRGAYPQDLKIPKPRPTQ